MRYIITYLNITKEKCYSYVIVILNTVFMDDDMVIFNENRSEALSIFQTLCNEIKNQFGISVYTLWTDNVKEFLSSSFMHFMLDTGISHQISCP